MGTGQKGYTTPPRNRVQRERDLLRYEPADLAASAAVVRRAVPRNPKALGKTLAEAHARWSNATENGDRGNPCFKLRRLFRGMKRAGLPVENALVVTRALEAFALALWAEDLEPTSAAIVQAITEETAAQGVADIEEIELAAGRMERAPQAVAAIDQHIARHVTLRVLLAKRVEAAC